MIRYADDLVCFFHSKSEAIAGQAFLEELLSNIELHIPKIGRNSKTAIANRNEPIDFLGREILYLQRERRFVSRVSDKQIGKIKTRLLGEYSFNAAVNTGKNLQQVLVELARSMSSYLGIYKNAYNYAEFEDELKTVGQSIITDIYLEIFGEDVLSKVSRKSLHFLGVGTINDVQPINEVDF